MTATVDLCSLRDSTAAVPLVHAEIPTALAHRGPVRRTGLPDVEEHHEERPACGEVVHSYRRGTAFVVAVLRLTARDLVLVSGLMGAELWDEVVESLSPTRRGSTGT